MRKISCVLKIVTMRDCLTLGSLLMFKNLISDRVNQYFIDKKVIGKIVTQYWTDMSCTLDQHQNTDWVGTTQLVRVNWNQLPYLVYCCC